MFGEEDDGLFSKSSGGKTNDALFPGIEALDGAIARGGSAAMSAGGAPLSAVLLKAAAGLEQSAARASGLEEEVERLTLALATAETAAADAAAASAAVEKALQETAKDTAAAAALADANRRADAAETEAVQLKGQMDAATTDAAEAMNVQAAQLKAATVRGKIYI